MAHQYVNNLYLLIIWYTGILVRNAISQVFSSPTCVNKADMVATFYNILYYDISKNVINEIQARVKCQDT